MHPEGSKNVLLIHENADGEHEFFLIGNCDEETIGQLRNAVDGDAEEIMERIKDHEFTSVNLPLRSVTITDVFHVVEE